MRVCICVCVCSDSPRTEFLLNNYTQPKELLLAIRELTYLGGNTNTGEARTQVRAVVTQVPKTFNEEKVLCYKTLLMYVKKYVRSCSKMYLND